MERCLRLKMVNRDASAAVATECFWEDSTAGRWVLARQEVPRKEPWDHFVKALTTRFIKYATREVLLPDFLTCKRKVAESSPEFMSRFEDVYTRVPSSGKPPFTNVYAVFFTAMRDVEVLLKLKERERSTALSDMEHVGPGVHVQERHNVPAQRMTALHTHRDERCNAIIATAMGGAIEPW